jgi:probable F420-dependent oxidoreductase
MTSEKPDLGRFGIFGAGVTPAQAKEFEALGYGAVWVAGSPAPELAWAEPALAQTSTLRLATGVINIWTASPETAAASYHRINEAYAGRFVLGVGVGGPEANTDYRAPLEALNAYLDKLDKYGVPPGRRIVAAMGPQMLKLAARRSAGAHPYLTTPQHTARAREILGPDVLLAPEASVVLTTDAAAARAIGRKSIEMNLILSSYVNNLKRMGFTDEDLARPGSDPLVDSVIAYGTADQVAARLQEHLDAGADHVAVQVLADPADLSPALAELAAALKLN